MKKGVRICEKSVRVSKKVSNFFFCALPNTGLNVIDQSSCYFYSLPCCPIKKLFMLQVYNPFLK